MPHISTNILPDNALSIVGISDVSIGYGSPEVPAIMHDICTRFPNFKGVLIEPDEPDRQPENRSRSFTLERVATTLKPQSLSWMRHFMHNALERIEALKPDILIIFGALVFPIIPALKTRPQKIIYHAYEQIADVPAEILAAHKHFLADIDLVISPSIARLIHDCSFLNVWPKNILEMRNSANVNHPETQSLITPKDKKNQFLWCGALDKQRTFADFFFAPDMAEHKFEMFGRITGDNKAAIHTAIKNAANINHNGIRPASELDMALRQSAYALTWWNPANSVGHFHLASNRFFTAITSATPPICGPHPQCIEINKKYNCAIILEDWTQQAFNEGIKKAANIFGSDQYSKIYQNCLDAKRKELAWSIQSEAMQSAILGVSNG